MNQTEVLWYEDLERSTGRSASVRRSDNRQVKRARAAKKARKARRRRRIRGMCMLFLLAIMLVCVLKGTFLSKRVILRASGCPESLIELAERQPEAYNFAKDYKKYANKDISIDISDEVKEGKIPLFIQWDKRWGYRDYGGNYMALNGCGPTCLSMVYCGLKGDTEWNPWKVAQWSSEHGYYVPGSGTAWSLMSEGAAQLGLQVMEAKPDADMITEELAKGKVIIACMGPGDFTTQGHFIVLTKVTGSGKILVNDPNSKKRSKQTWDVDRLVGQMKDMWVYQ